MKPAEFKNARKALRLSSARMVTALAVADGRTIRRWESGQHPIPGTVELVVRQLLRGRESAEPPEWLIATTLDGVDEVLIHNRAPRFTARVALQRADIADTLSGTTYACQGGNPVRNFLAGRPAR